jgi:RNA 2',3'-cyclic 3'-phosphodiesterase
MRLFVALPVPDEVRAGILAALGDLPSRHPELRWTRPEGWHITLAFLGAVPEDEVDRIAEAVRDGVRLVAPVRALRLLEPGRFGRKVVFLRVADEPEGALERLALAVRAELAAVEWPVDPRGMAPHLTLARAGRAAVDATLLDDLRLPSSSATTWGPTSVELWSSHLGSGPARYAVEASVPITA